MSEAAGEWKGASEASVGELVLTDLAASPLLVTATSSRPCFQHEGRYDA